MASTEQTHPENCEADDLCYYCRLERNLLSRSEDCHNVFLSLCVRVRRLEEELCVLRGEKRRALAGMYPEGSLQQDSQGCDIPWPHSPEECQIYSH